MDGLRRWAADLAFKAWPNLVRLTCTDRVQHTVNHHDLAGFLFSRDGAWRTESRTVDPIIDRIGGGDAFAAGLAHALIEDLGPQAAVDYGAALGALAMTTPGDTSMVRQAEVEAVMKGKGARVIR